MEVVSTLLDAVIKEAFEKIVKKIREGKKLTDAEVLLLVVSQMRREQEIIAKEISDIKSEIRDLKDEIKFLRHEVSSIKSDIINILKEKI